MIQDRFLTTKSDFFDGYSSMINDQKRNQFYEYMLADIVKDKSILEIGFGTGILSFMAIAAGAKKITAYEQRSHVYDLAEQILQDYDFKEKIELINQRYSSSKTDHDFLLHEVLAEDIWGEYLYYIIKDLHHNVFPGVYYLNVNYAQIDETFFSQLDSFTYSLLKSKTEILHHKPFEAQADFDFKFKPGVNIDQSAIVSTQKQMRSMYQHFYDYSPKMLGIFEELNFDYKNQRSYEIDVNDKSVLIKDNNDIFSNNSITELPQYITIPIFTSQVDTYILLNLDFGIKHNDQSLSLSSSYPGKSWDQFQAEDLNKLVYIEKGKTLYLTQYLTNGKLVYTSK